MCYKMASGLTSGLGIAGIILIIIGIIMAVIGIVLLIARQSTTSEWYIWALLIGGIILGIIGGVMLAIVLVYAPVVAITPIAPITPLLSTCGPIEQYSMPVKYTNPPTQYVQQYVQQRPVQYVQQPPPVQYVQQAPPVQYVQQAPPVQYVQQPPSTQYVKQPPVQYVQQAPSTQYVQQPPSTQYVQQPPVQYVQQAPVQYVQQPLSQPLLPAVTNRRVISQQVQEISPGNFDPDPEVSVVDTRPVPQRVTAVGPYGPNGEQQTVTGIYQPPLQRVYTTADISRNTVVNNAMGVQPEFNSPIMYRAM